MNNEIKIMIADDHAIIREGIKNLLEFDGKIKVVEQASNGEECLELLKGKDVDVLLLDVNMPKKNGLEVLEALRNKGSNIKIIILTVHNEIEYLERAMDLGVNGYILKDSSSAELINAIERVSDGEKYIQPDLIPALNAKLIHRDNDREKLEAVTKRELQALILVAKGYSNKDIAMELNISERTVKNHLSSIFKKIEVDDRTQAAVFAIKNNLVNIF
ncbi:MAG: response regulator transcription factor [Lachnospiraceae bacterium]|nr:response regulator transcription factor [Lachnospiraceae bacterium]